MQKDPQVAAEVKEILNIIKQYNPEIATKEKLEDVIDLPTVYKIIEVAAGIKLNDPNALAAALVGTN